MPADRHCGVRDCLDREEVHQRTRTATYAAADQKSLAGAGEENACTVPHPIGTKRRTSLEVDEPSISPKRRSSKRGKSSWINDPVRARRLSAANSFVGKYGLRRPK